MFIFTVNTCVLSSQELCYYPTKPVVLITTIFNERLRQPCFVSDTHPLPAHFLTHIPSPCFVSTAHTCAHSLHTHTHTHTPTHTHTHTIIITTIRPCWGTVALNLSSSSPPPVCYSHQPPTHSSISLHAGIPLATVVWWCLPSNQKALSPSYMAYGMGVCGLG